MSAILQVFLMALWLGLVACGSKSGPCRDDYDCDGTEVCRKATGKCEPFLCREDADCLDPRYRCDDNSCVLK